MGGEVGAYLGDLGGEVAEEGGGSVGGGVFVQADIVCICSGDGGVCKFADAVEAVGFVTRDVLASESRKVVWL